MKFIEIVWAAFLARQKPVSTMANPACMNMTRKPVMSVQTMLIEILLWPTVAITSASVGALASFTGTSDAVPVLSPVGSGGAGAAGAAAAGDCAGAGAASVGAPAGAGPGSRALVVREPSPPTPPPPATPRLNP